MYEFFIYFGYLCPISCMIYKYFLPFSRLRFHFFGGFLGCAEAFWFEIVLLAHCLCCLGLMAVFLLSCLFSQLPLIELQPPFCCFSTSISLTPLERGQATSGSAKELDLYTMGKVSTVSKQESNIINFMFENSDFWLLILTVQWSRTSD